ncbi:MAG: RNA polymerase sigma factor SigZ [Acidobacteriota bacterium]
MQSQAEISRDILWNELTVDLKKFIVRRVPNAADAEDLLQDALFKIHRNIERLAPNSNLYAWVYQVTRHTIIDYYRNHQPNVSLDTANDLPEDFAETVSTRNVISEIAACLQPMLKRLPEKYREALTLADLEGITQTELAGRLGISLSGAKSRVQRAREQLRAVIAECCHFEFDCRGQVKDYQCKKPYTC